MSAAYRALVIQRHRHLKWRALDGLEALLMVLCGVCIGMFTLSVLLDVVTRTIGHPWLWLQQVTTAFFAWGVFVGMAAATRRNDHFYLAEITKRLTGSKRRTIEVFNRLVVYRSHMLHSGRIPPGAELSDDPRRGRLTANIFVTYRA